MLLIANVVGEGGVEGEVVPVVPAAVVVPVGKDFYLAARTGPYVAAKFFNKYLS